MQKSSSTQTSSLVQPAIAPAVHVTQISDVEAMIGIAVFLVGLGISWGTLKNEMRHITTIIRDKIEPDLKDVRERFAGLEGRLGNTYGGASPIKLLEKGEEIIQKSGLKKYIDGNREMLLEKFKSTCTVANQYDIQEQAFNFFDELDFGTFEDALKKAAFDYGMNISTLRRIGGIYFRDICLEAAGFNPEDLDEPKATEKAL